MISKIYRFFIDNFRELFLYGLIGGGAVAIDLGLFWVFVNMGGDAGSKSELYVQVANVIAIVFAIVYSFTLNSIFTFKKRDHLLRRFASFFGVSTVGIVISAGMLFVLSRVGVDINIAKVISLPFIFITQFVLNRFITFKDVEDHSDDNIIELAIEEGDLI